MAVSCNTTTNDARLAQIRAHRIFDQIWKRKFVPRRCDAYAWMRRTMGLSHKGGHISRFTAEQCELLIGMVYRDYPKLRTRYSRILYGGIDIEE